MSRSVLKEVVISRQCEPAEGLLAGSGLVRDVLDAMERLVPWRVQLWRGTIQSFGGQVLPRDGIEKARRMESGKQGVSGVRDHVD